jgi:hypothetical protein
MARSPVARLREADHIDADDLQLANDIEDATELRPSAVDHDQIWEIAVLHAGFESPPQDFFERREVVVAIFRHLVVSIPRLLGLPFGERHAAPDHLPREVRDVVALHASRRSGEFELPFKSQERFRRLFFAAAVVGKREFRIATRHVEQPERLPRSATPMRTPPGRRAAKIA